MRYLIAFTGFLAVTTFAFSNDEAYAGFEWLPPSHMTSTPAPVKPAPTQSHTMAPAPLEPVSEMTPMPSSPAPTVTMEKLETTTMPANIEPASGLMIDPYPLRAKKLVSMTTQRSTVEQALVEETDVLNPLPLGGNMDTGIQAPSARLAMTGIETDPMALTPMDTGMTPMPVDAQPLPGSFPNAIGFAKDVPLALALSQVIPDDFSHSYMRGVDAGKIVSWDGGKPWNEVLLEMLQPQGLAFQIQDKKVVVHEIGQL